MVNKKPIDLSFSDDDKDSETDAKSSSAQLRINKNYAEKYDNWRSKEEIQKLKDRYGDELNSDESDSTSESEDDDAKELNDEVEKEFFKALSMVKSKDARIYDKDSCKFFGENESQEDDDENDQEKKSKNKTTKSKDKKQYFLKDLERDMILKKINKLKDDDALNDTNIYEEDEQESEKKPTKGYYEEQEDIKKNLKKVIAQVENDDEDDPDDFLKVKVKSKEEKEKEEADYIEWLKGRKEKVQDPEIEKNMKYLHDYWNDPKLSEGEKYLRDYILNKRYLFKDDEEDDNEESSSSSEEEEKTEKNTKKEDEKPAQLDFVDFSEEEDIIEQQEEFERKFNFRFEEPDPEFIKSYPRTVADSMRRKDTKRKEKREEYKKRKELEKQKKKEEIKRLKSLKRKEIEKKLEKIKKITGNEDLKLTLDDLEKDFDPDEYEKRMQDVFNDDYYQHPDPDVPKENDNDDDKPVFTDDSDEDLKYQTWDEWSVNGKKQTQPEDDNQNDDEESSSKKKEKKKKKKKNKNADDEYQDPDFNMDCDYDESADSKSKKKSKLAEALLKQKPTFDPNEKTFEEYIDEYYKMDCEDVIGGDLPCRFKYREVVPNDFGLDVDEILNCDDNELNQWASIKKVVEYKPIQDDVRESKLYKTKKDRIDLKQKILTSLFKKEENKDDEQKENDLDEETNEATANEDSQDEEQKSNPKIKKSKKIEKPEKSTDKKQPQPQVVDKKNKTPSDKQSVQKTNNGKVSKNKNKKKKNKNVLESITDERLAAFGLNPKKFKKKLKYGSN